MHHCTTALDWQFKTDGSVLALLKLLDSPQVRARVRARAGVRVRVRVRARARVRVS